MAKSTLHSDVTDTVDPYTTRVTNLRIFSDGNEWFLDGSDGEGRYTESCWTFDSFADAVAAMPAFVENQPANGVVFDWRNQRARNYVLHYVSQDVGDRGEALPAWSVYREEYLSENALNGDPIDGSQVRVSTHPTEALAEAEAQRRQDALKQAR